jgi:hypothetical protein
MDYLITEAYHLKGGQKHPIKGKKISSNFIGTVMMNVWGVEPNRMTLSVNEGTNGYSRMGVDYTTPREEMPVKVSIPLSPGYHDIQIRLNRFSCSLDYTII